MKYKFLLFPLQSHISLSKVSFGVRNYTTQRLAFQKNAIHSSNRSHFHTSSAVWEKDSHSTPIPQLMNSVDMRIMKPSLFKLFTNHISARLIITPYFDNDFNIPDFKIGAKQAIVAVSSALSSGNIAALEDIVEKDALAEIKRNFSFFSVSQQQELAVHPNDFVRSFVYEIGIMFEDNDQGVQERFVEITFCAHILRGLNELTESNMAEMSLKDWLERGDRGMICNYRFIREFTKGVEGQWLINYINHFKL